ncbi:hypothetical protein [Methylomicrobium sp. Wu6]|uniref:hypothetical protein n=1 Tax=Methylomicrobium sp. Wu6 TaxID=3107928 RepID=UPI002DD62B81|nr:hypothetical protein [Methylomicrobium sp. Wu6]MEC4749805.1 hypothetical protein [Methylomicrobium sp. Wu6]
MKRSERYSIESLSNGTDQDRRGLIFANKYGLTDLSGVNVVGASVDTVRQLFYGTPKSILLERIQRWEANKDQIVTLTDNPLSMKWHFTRMGKVSGYRYKFQNNEEGVVILFGSFYRTLESEGDHLKIELSPHYISQRPVKSIWGELFGLGGLAHAFLSDATPKGVAVHLACDYQGYDLPDDFIFKFSTYSRTFKAYDGIHSIDLSDFTEAVATYGGKNQAKNYLIGQPRSIQICIYDKSFEIKKSDKVDYFTREWGWYSLGTYDPDKSVRRIEARIHQSIIREIGNGLGVELESFEQVEKYLTDIWRYAISKNVLMLDKKLIDPFWQLLLEDVEFLVPAQNTFICRKKKQSVDPVSKNITSIVGNMISLCARQRMNANQVYSQLRLLAVWPMIDAYYRSRGIYKSEFIQFLEKLLCLRRIAGSATQAA